MEELRQKELLKPDQAIWIDMFEQELKNHLPR
jgi:hypothetical protein